MTNRLNYKISFFISSRVIKEISLSILSSPVSRVACTEIDRYQFCRIHIRKFRFFVTLQSILTFTRYSGFDPEVGGWGIDCGIYPQPRTYIAGVDVVF